LFPISTVVPALEALAGLPEVGVTPRPEIAPKSFNVTSKLCPTLRRNSAAKKVVH
jgi:hypothetical protein